MGEWKHLNCGSVFCAKTPPMNCEVCNGVKYETGWVYLGPTPPGKIKRAKYGKGKVSPLRRQNIYARDGNRCVNCGATELLTLDHIVPRSKGGTNRSENLQTMCRDCNQAKANRQGEITRAANLSLAPFGAAP